MRGAAVLMLVLLAAALLPSSALAVAPVNDTQAGAATLDVHYGAPASVAVSSGAGAGGWLDATATEDGQPGAPAVPACFGSPGFHSMWYLVRCRSRAC